MAWINLDVRPKSSEGLPDLLVASVVGYVVSSPPSLVSFAVTSSQAIEGVIHCHPLLLVPEIHLLFDLKVASDLLREKGTNKAS